MTAATDGQNGMDVQPPARRPAPIRPRPAASRSSTTTSGTAGSARRWRAQCSTTRRSCSTSRRTTRASCPARAPGRTVTRVDTHVATFVDPDGTHGVRDGWCCRRVNRPTTARYSILECKPTVGLTPPTATRSSPTSSRCNDVPGGTAGTPTTTIAAPPFRPGDWATTTNGVVITDSGGRRLAAYDAGTATWRTLPGAADQRATLDLRYAWQRRVRQHRARERFGDRHAVRGARCGHGDLAHACSGSGSRLRQARERGRRRPPVRLRSIRRRLRQSEVRPARGGRRVRRRAATTGRRCPTWPLAAERSGEARCNGRAHELVVWSGRRTTTRGAAAGRRRRGLRPGAPAPGGSLPVAPRGGACRGCERVDRHRDARAGAAPTASICGSGADRRRARPTTRRPTGGGSSRLRRSGRPRRPRRYGRAPR